MLQFTSLFHADQPAFNSGFEHGSFVAFEVGFDALEVSDGFVEARELFFDLRDDTFLLVAWRDWNQNIPNDSLTDIRLCSTNRLCDQV
jgi:hypothetical protein